MSRRIVTLLVSFLAVLATLVAGGLFAFSGGQAAQATDRTLPVKAAFYYPWFPETENWTTQYHPTLGKYSSDDTANIDKHIDMAKYAGLDAFISSWWGAGSKTAQRLPMILDRAAAKGFSISAYYEPEGTADPTIATIQNDLAAIPEDHAAYLHVNGKPVLFIYNAGASGCAEVTKWKQAAPGWYLNMKVFSGYANCADQPDSWHQYAPASAVQTHAPYAMNVSPGFFKFNETTPRLARDLTRFKSDLANLAAANVQWKLITSFSEWGEGTAVEPATEWASTSGYGDYLDALHAQFGTATPPPSTTLTPSSTPPPPPPSNTVTKVLVFVEENHSLNEMKSGMPYTYSLAQKYGYATGWKAIRHPSLPNYLAMAGGSTFSVTDDAAPSSHPINASSVFGQAITAGKMAKTYAESETSNCQLTSSGNYAVKHNPWAYFTPTATERSQCQKFDVPEARNLTNDINAGTLPNVGMVVPNLANDAHDGSLATADNWFKARMQAILAGPDWKSGHLAVILTADEDDSSQSNTVLTTVIHPSQNAHVVTVALNHYSLTRFLEDVAHAPYLQGAATAADMKSAFGLAVG